MMTKLIKVIPPRIVNKSPVNFLIVLSDKAVCLLPRKLKLSTIASISFLFFASTVLIQSVHSHSGGTDAGGCHTNSKTGDYHCHTTKSGTSSSSSSGSSSSYSPRIPAQSLETLSGLSEEEFASDPGCKKFSFSQLISQSDQGEVNLNCGQVLIYIRSH